MKFLSLRHLIVSSDKDKQVRNYHTHKLDFILLIYKNKKRKTFSILTGIVFIFLKYFSFIFITFNTENPSYYPTVSRSIPRGIS